VITTPPTPHPTNTHPQRQVALSILAGDGFAFDVPSRAKANQVYVKVRRGLEGRRRCGGVRRRCAAGCAGFFSYVWTWRQQTNKRHNPTNQTQTQTTKQELDRIVLREASSKRPFASTASCRKAAVTARILQLVHELCAKRIHVTKRDLFYTDVKLFEVCAVCGDVKGGWLCLRRVVFAFPASAAHARTHQLRLDQARTKLTTTPRETTTPNQPL
jgi:hypothetical protein